MPRHFLLFATLLLSAVVRAQSLQLSVEKIMRDPKWIGSSPSSPFWSADGKYLYFNWNPDNAAADSLYFISRDNLQPQKAGYARRISLVRDREAVYNAKRNQYLFERDGDIFLTDVKTGTEKRITQTADNESNPAFIAGDSKIAFNRGQNIFTWDMSTGQLVQLVNFTAGNPPPQAGKDNLNAQEKWLKEDQLRTFEVLRSRKLKKDQTDSLLAALPKKKTVRTIYLGDKMVLSPVVSPNGRFISYRLLKNAQGKSTIVPNYVTESGFTEDIPGRTKVGAAQSAQDLYFYDLLLDSSWRFNTASIEGIKDIPAFYADYPAQLKKKQKDSTERPVDFLRPVWSPDGNHAVADIHSKDNKDRWLYLVEPASGKLTLLDRQHDDAWISGPGIGGGFGGASEGWINDETFWYQSEKTGYSHLYTVNIATGEKKALTEGRYEIQQAYLSNDKKYFYISSNEVHPGEQQFYRLEIANGKTERITRPTGACQVSLSPDEKQIGFLYSYSNKPWELYLQENKPGSKEMQVTSKGMSDEFKSYPWRDPALITFKARDGAMVYARLYKPAQPAASKPAVIFVHGAGYLQNAHKWWSSYFREYMFNNLLCDKGYTVMDIDYRGSAGYGRDWRTGIYRFMGGKDLTDQVDAAKYMTDSLGVNPSNIGLYGGSYGGFITLMALFTTPDVFKAGAALRPVTDWAQYNHGYTSNILNEPFTDSIAYRRSSPLYWAAGLKNHLLICHGIVDTNVNFQDAVKLSQRLIELGKDNWEIIGYPMEDHGFVEPSSWTDEYKRILKLFETNLK